MPPASQLLDLGCGAGRHTEAFLRLGFPVHACDPREAAVEATRARVGDLLEQGSAETAVQRASLDALEYPDATFDWVLAADAETVLTDRDDLGTLFEEGRRLLKPGGWLYVSVPAVDEDGEGTDVEDGLRFAENDVERHRTAADLAEASAPTVVRRDGGRRIRAIYRRVEPHTPA